MGVCIRFWPSNRKATWPSAVFTSSPIPNRPSPAVDPAWAAGPRISAALAVQWPFPWFCGVLRGEPPT